MPSAGRRLTTLINVTHEPSSASSASRELASLALPSLIVVLCDCRSVRLSPHRLSQGQAEQHGQSSVARAAVVKLFLAFIKRVGVSYERIGFLHICWYIDYIASHSYSPSAIANHVFHLRTFYKLSALPDVALHHYRVHLALRAVSISIGHTLDPKHAVSPHILCSTVACLRDQPHADPLVLGVLLRIMGFMHQSSIVSASVSTLDPTRHLTRHDPTLTPSGLVIHLKWTKTIQKSADLKTLMLPYTRMRPFAQYLHTNSTLAATHSAQRTPRRCPYSPSLMGTL